MKTGIKNNIFELNAYLTIQRETINSHLERRLEKASYRGRLLEAMAYSLMAGGKRIRPVLCISAAHAVGEESQAVMSVACALEMIHTYSLIHDDLPAMDDDQIRRGKPTCHVQFDEATAILAGDALVTLAFETITDAYDLPAEISNPEKRLRTIRLLAKAAGCAGMVDGQMQDMMMEGTTIDLNALEKLHSLKTGALIQASVVSGATMGGGNNGQIEHLRLYAKKIGLAFQISDDILNIEGDPDVMGKAVGTDDFKHKNTFPALMGLNASKKHAEKLIDEALNALSSFDDRSDPLRAIAVYIIERKL